MMNIDVTAGVMFKGGPLIDISMAILGINNVREFRASRKGTFSGIFSRV